MDIGHDLSKALPQGIDQDPTLSSDSTLLSEREQIGHILKTQ